MKKAQEAGIKISECYRNTARSVKFIVTALPSSTEVEKTLKREGGVFDVAGKGTHICNVGEDLEEEVLKSLTDGAKESGMTFRDCREVDVVPFLNKMMGNNIFDFSSDSDFTAKLLRKNLGFAMDSAKSQL